MSYSHNRFLLETHEDHTTSAADTYTPVPGGGDVVGPASAVNNTIVRFDTSTGKLIQGSAVSIDDTGNVSGIGNITLTGTVDGVDIATRDGLSVINNSTGTDNAIARFETDGKTVQDSGVIIDDSDNISGIGNITLTGTVDGVDIATRDGLSVINNSTGTDNAIARFDTDGKTVQDSGVIIDDSDNISGIGNIDISGSLNLSNELQLSTKTDVQEAALTGANGKLIYNSDKTKLRTYNNSDWKTVVQTGDSEGWSSDASTGAVVIISLRKVKESYIGPCCNVRRSSDDANLDIYFDPETNALNKVDFDVFIGGGSGFLEIIYDQSGNGNNFQNTNHSEQPEIIFETLGGNQIPYLSWTVNANALQCVNDTDSMSLTGNDYWYSTIFKTSETGVRFLASSSTDGHYEVHLGSLDTNIRSLPNGVPDYSDITISGQDWNDNLYHSLLVRQQGSLYVAVGSNLTSDLRYDGVLYGPADEDFVNSSTNVNLRWGARSTIGATGFGGVMNELIVYSSAPVNISVLETNQSDFWKSGYNPIIYGSISAIEVFSSNVKIDKPLYLSGSIYENSQQGSLIKTNYGLSGNNFNIGTDTLEKLNSSSFGNIAIGNSAGKNITSGDENLCIGDYAGDGITTGSNNIIIGRTADCLAAGNNQISIGDSADCDASNQCTIGDANLAVIRPGADNVCDLGQVSRRYKDAYLNGVVKSDGTGINHFIGNTSFGITANFAKVYIFNDLGSTASGLFIENDSSGSGTIVSAFGVSIRTDTNGGTATITDNFNILVNTPTTSAGNAITNNFGLYIGDMNTSQVTNPYGVRQFGSTNLNQFDGYVAINATASSSYNLLVGGGYYNGSGTAWTVVSDKRIKQNIVDKDVNLCLSNINSLKIRNFTYTDDYIKCNNRLNKDLQTGIIAQEVEIVLPACVKTIPSHTFEHPECKIENCDVCEGRESDGELVRKHKKEITVENKIEGLKTFNSDQLIYDLIGAVQALTKRIEILEK